MLQLKNSYSTYNEDLKYPSYEHEVDDENLFSRCVHLRDLQAKII